MSSRSASALYRGLAVDRKRPFGGRQSGLDMKLLFPSPRQQFVETVDGMSIDHARQHIGKVGIRFDAVQFTGFDQRTDDCPTISAAITAREQVVLAAERHRTDRALDRVGVELEAAIMP